MTQESDDPPGDPLLDAMRELEADGLWEFQQPEAEQRAEVHLQSGDIRQPWAACGATVEAEEVGVDPERSCTTRVAGLVTCDRCRQIIESP